MIHPLKNADGVWHDASQSAVFRWEADGNNDRYVHLIGIMDQNGTLEPDFKSRQDKDLRQATGADMLSMTFHFPGNLYGVVNKKFMLFSSEEYGYNEADIRKALESSEKRDALILTITIGHAELEYWIKSVKTGDVRAVSFSIQSSADIADGIVGYSYDLGSRSICLPFPGMIKGKGKKQKQKFESILIPENSQIRVVVTDKHFSGNVIIKEGSFFGGLF